MNNEVKDWLFQDVAILFVVALVWAGYFVDNWGVELPLLLTAVALLPLGMTAMVLWQNRDSND